jgi:eukaryotic-like serine/threonine-protein kinase
MSRDRLGEYELLQPIASGGMGTVYLARKTSTGELRAIKRIHAHLHSGTEFVCMLRDEARLSGRVNHRNVVRTYELCESDGAVFLVMEYIAGRTLYSVFRNLPDHMPPAPIALAMIRDVLCGLHAAHSAVAEDHAPLGLIHRDISPQNVIVGEDGITRILDFGVAKARGNLQETAEGVVKGKLAYMAPETLRGAPVTQRVDVYASGVLLWELLAGQRLFQGESDAVTIGRVLEHVIPRPSSRSASAPAALDSVVLQATARAPEQRYESAQAFLGALDAVATFASAAEVTAWLQGTPGSRAHHVAALPTEAEVQPTRTEVEVRRSGRSPARMAGVLIALAGIAAAAGLAMKAGVTRAGTLHVSMLEHAKGAAAASSVARDGVQQSAIAPEQAPSATRPRVLLSTSAKLPVRKNAGAPPPVTAKTRDPSTCYVADSTGTLHIRAECL